MNNPVALVMENIFNIAYLATVWGIAFFMVKGRKGVAEADRGLASRMLLAVVLLAGGDTFHVGARVLTWIAGPAASTVVVGGVPSSLLGLGMMATAYTMTIFYMVLAEARTLRSGGKPDAAFWVMEILLGLRLILMALPGNFWDRAVPPYGMGLVRNLPLAVAGFLMAALFIIEGRRDGDRAWAGLGWAMLASYAFYTPVILFAVQVPALGFLMIPKTVAYVVMGLIAWRRYFRRASSRAGAGLAFGQAAR